MKKQRFSTEQIVSVLKQAEMGLPVKDLIRQIGITEQTFYRWKRQYGGLESNQVRELKQVVEENARLKRLVAELSLSKGRFCRTCCQKPRPAPMKDVVAYVASGSSMIEHAHAPRRPVPPPLVTIANAGMRPCAECFEGFRPNLYGHRIGCFHRLALGFRAQPLV